MAFTAPQTDILILGSGAAGLTAALSARLFPTRPTVTLVDACPASWAGGNSYFTAGAYRTVHSGLSSLLPLVSNVPPEVRDNIDLDPYTEEDFMGDMVRITDGRCETALARELVKGSAESVRWLGKVGGVDWRLSWKRQAYEVNGRWKFWGGLALTVGEEGGKGLVRGLMERVKEEGVDVQWETRGVGLVTGDEGRVAGVRVKRGDGSERVLMAKAVVMCAGGFEANRKMRGQWLGENWRGAHVRGTPFNDGGMLEVAVMDVGAERVGDWAGCHAVAWDAEAPMETGDREVGNEFTKSGYPLGIMVNVRGERFVDEGVDLRNYTYAMFGRAILEQDRGVVWQVWDSRTIGWLRGEEYRDERVRKIRGETIEELASGMVVSGLENAERFLRTIKEFNDAVYRAQAENRDENRDKQLDPAVKDGLTTQSSTGGLELPKSNWALPIDKPPFLAVKVGSGITFTFGGLKINPENAAVISQTTRQEIPGLYCAGEMVGGLFYGNYPGGSGLTSGAVFGRKAGVAAARYAGTVEEAG
ncbi:hypothetical protein MMC08_001682 [Hypocenomyce scalaris]|nr:hypothetical protein [Hypocenomyce scalaris]